MPGIWSRHRDEITVDRLHKFWGELPVQARRSLLRIDKQAFFEQARKNLYCSRCNGLLLESFTQIVMYGKSVQQHHEGISGNSLDPEDEEAQDPAVHPWGGLAATKDGLLTLLECFINSRSLRPLQNVFDSARAREREREMLYPDACGGDGRGWISQGGGGSFSGYGRGHGTRETCALHTARLSCDTLMDFWSALGDETRASLLQMKEDDFIERLIYRFDSKRFCRDCRKNVIKEFKELKELKRMRRETRCTSWFCGPDTAFQYEVSDSSVQADWQELFSDGKYHHFDWAVGTSEGKGDILDYQDVGMNRKVLHTGLDLTSISTCYISLRACRLDGHVTELCVKAHALKGQRCVHQRLIVGDGFLRITKGESMRQFFEYAEEAEEEDEEDAMERDGSDMDGDGSHPQKHAKSPELAREFLLDAAIVIFKEQVEKAFREGTARQNAHSVFVSLALQLLEDRVHVACKDIITLEKQTKLLEEEEKEKREEEERRERRRNKEREKKLRKKERLKGKESCEKGTEAEVETESSFSELKSWDEELSQDSQKHLIESTEECESPPECSEYVPHSTDTPREEDEPSKVHFEYHQCQVDTDDSFILEQSKSTRRRLKYSNDPGSRNAVAKKNNRNPDLTFRLRGRYDYEYHSCGCGDRGQDGAYHQQSYKPRQSYYRSVKFSNNGYTSDSFTVQKGSGVGTGGISKKDQTLKQVWEPMDSRKKTTRSASIYSTANHKEFNSDLPEKADYESNEDNTCQKHGQGEDEEQFQDSNHREGCNLEQRERPDLCTGYNTSSGSPINHGRDLDNCSSCPSEGDSSISSSSGPHNESSSSMSDSEDASQQSDSRDNSTCTNEKNDNIFLQDLRKELEPDSPLRKDSPKKCSVLTSPPEKESGNTLLVSQVTRDCENENETKTVHLRNGPLPAHTQPVHGASAIYPSVGLGYHNQPVTNSWAGPTCGYPFSQPGHYSYPNHHLGYVSMQYAAPMVHPFPTAAHSFGMNLQPPVYKQYRARDNTIVSHPGLNPSIADPIGNRRVLPPQNPNMERRVVNPMPQVSTRPNSNSMKSNEEKFQNEDPSHFSLFHFGGPTGCRDELKLKDGKNGGLQCTREDSDVKEYNLFSSKGSFSFF